MEANVARVRPARLTRRDPTGVILFGLAVLLGAAVAVTLAYPETVSREFLLFGLALIVPLPILFRAIQGKLDLLEPVVFIALGHISLYLARPLAQLAYGQTSISGLEIMSGYDMALAISFIGVVAVYAGYSVPTGRTIASRLRPPPKDWSNDTTLIVALIAFAIGMLLWAMFLAQSGGFSAFTTYIQGRSAADAARFQGSSGYFYLAPFVAIPCALILFDANARRRSLILLLGGLICLGFTLLITGPRGDRTFLLLLLLPLIAQHYLRRGRRPNGVTALVGILVAILVVNVLISYRRVDERKGSFATSAVESVSKPGQQLKEFVLGQDTTMFPLTAIMVESDLGHLPLSTVKSLLASPVPGSIWPTKPRDPDTIFYREVFPQAASQVESGNALGYLGSYWYDGGFIGLAIYAFLSGILFRIAWEYLKRFSTYRGAQLLFSISLPFTIVLIRGNPTQSFPPGLFVVGPVIALLWLAGRRARQPA